MASQHVLEFMTGTVDLPEESRQPRFTGASGEERLPICVDLDGTLIAGDMLEESFLQVLCASPLEALSALLELRRGRAACKRYLAERAAIAPEQLPYNQPLLAYLHEQKRRGHPIYLVTASDAALARRIAEHLALFDGVLATEGGLNLKGRRKAQVLSDRFGVGNFIYAGDAACDIHVWQAAAEAILVNPTGRLERKVRASVPIRKIFSAPRRLPMTLLRAMRAYQWVKNLLVFVPVLLAQAWGSGATLRNAAVMFAAFSLAASGCYIINDLLDLKADRSHPRKRRRPFASGALPLRHGALGPVLIMLGLGLAASISLASALVLLGYVALTSAYSCYLKTRPLIDAFVLAGLYTLRIIGGAVACSIALSNWLLAFSGSLFLALAFIKRVGELRDLAARGADMHRRGYSASDTLVIQTMGLASSFMSALVLALYIDTNPASLYAEPRMLWLMVPAILFWQCRLWLSTSRGYMSDDTIVYAARDKVSWLCFAVVALAFIGAITLPPGVIP